MTAIYILLRPFGRHYGAYWVREHCLAALITLRLMVRLSGRIMRLNKLLERLRTKARIGYKLSRWWSLLEQRCVGLNYAITGACYVWLGVAHACGPLGRSAACIGYVRLSANLVRM